MATYTLNSKNSYEGRKLRLYCTSTVNVTNNSSTINWTLYSEGGSSGNYSTGPTTVTINGVQVYYKDRVSYSSKTFPASKGSVSGVLTVTHNSDGKKSINVSLSTAIYTATVTTNSGTWTLDNIPRQATITSAPNFTDIQNPTIQYSNPAGNNVTTLQACISLTGSNSDIAYRNISKTGTSYTFNLTEAERNVLRQACTTSNTRTVYFYVKTVIGGNTLYQNKPVTLTIVNANPTFNVAYLDTNSTTTAITGNNQQIIQNNSTLQINITNATALKYATLKTASINVNGTVTTKNISGSSLTFDVGSLNVANNLIVPITITDSRNNKTTTNLTIQVLEWSLPTAIITLVRESNYYTQTNLNVNADYSSLDSKNTITIQYQIKKVDESTYGSLTTIQDNVETQFNADNQYSWNVKVILTDRIGSATYNLLLYKGIPLMYWDRFLSSIGINCFPVNQYSLEINGVQIYGTDKTGELEDLQTTDKTTLVAAINEARTTGSGSPLIPKTTYTSSNSDVYSCNYVNDLVKDTYSTMEQKIGYWIDGKPIYRKVIILNNFAIADNVVYNHNISNIDTIVYTRGITYVTTSYATMSYPTVAHSGAALNYYVTRTQLLFGGTDTWSANQNRYHIFTIEYTKTTD